MATRYEVDVDLWEVPSARVDARADQVREARPLLDLIKRVDGADAEYGHRTPAFVRAYVATAACARNDRGPAYRAGLARLGISARDLDPEAYARARRDVDEPRDIDPNGGLYQRSGRGANATVGGHGSQRKPDEMPPLATMRDVKAAALALGAFDVSIRRKVADAVLARMAELGLDALAERYRDLWFAQGAIDELSDVDAQLAGDAHSDTCEQIAARKLASRSQAEHESPGRRRSRQQIDAARRRTK